jgi:hypothetical protein
MKKLLIRTALIAGMAATATVGAAAPAFAKGWHVQGQYDTGTSCSYSGYYGQLNGRWEDYACRQEPVNRVWFLFVYN